MATANLEPTAGVKKRKGSISEDDVSLILQRYTATTILSLLQEVSQATNTRKIDWKLLVKRTSTGITCAREYQMLWRHLAYRVPLSERVDDGVEPLDDESDLEFELEPVPTPNEESLLEAAACVKVLINNSGTEPQSTHHNGTNDGPPRVTSDKQQTASRNFRPVLDQKPPVQSHGTGGPPVLEGMDASTHAAATGAPPLKKKRKPWTREEDSDLIAAVERFGEGNWIEILKGDYFKHDRTPCQLGQRWAVIRKKQASANQSNGVKNASSEEERKATQKAISVALGLSSYDSESGSILSGPVSNARPKPLSTPQTLINIKPTQLANQKNLTLTTITTTTQNPKPRAAPKKQQTLTTTTLAAGGAAATAATTITTGGAAAAATTAATTAATAAAATTTSSLIQAAAFAAGGRIATPSTAASLRKAAQSKNAVHIRSSAGVALSRVTIGPVPNPINNNGNGNGNGNGSSIGNKDCGGPLPKRPRSVAVSVEELASSEEGGTKDSEMERKEVGTGENPNGGVAENGMNGTKIGVVEENNDMEIDKDKMGL